ncbi:MAG: hypothetical protein Q9183_003611, partial [Haloplaca sp. 2 TL-2023]
MFHRFRRKKVQPLVIPEITETLPQSPHQHHSATLPSNADVQRNSTNLSTYNILPNNSRNSSFERHRRERSIERQGDPQGLNVLYEPPEGSPTVDIIFVHGLGGTSQKTWSRNRDLDFFWPREWLPFEPGFTQARILSFGYNAHFAAHGRENILNITDFARDLLYGMKYGLNQQSQELDIGKVPVIFVAHSMGGLVVKKAMILSRNDDQYQQTMGSAHAILFLSTPHRGYPSEVSKPLDADHHNVCKFTSQQDPNYVSVRNALKYVLPKTQVLEPPSPTSSTETEEVDMTKAKKLLTVSGAPEEDLEHLQSLWMPGSCEWILSRPVFQSWLDDESARSRLLWVYGPPGCGKSILSSFVVRQLQDMGHMCQYFFFSFGDGMKRTINLLLRSLAYQVATTIPDFRTQLEKLADDTVRLEKAEGRAIWQKLFISKLCKIRLQKPIYWIIDALDECEAPEKLLTLLSSIDSSRCPLRVMLVSRKTQGLSHACQRLESSNQVDHLNIGDAKEDMEAYAAQEIAYLRGGPEIKARVRRTIRDKASGNFLWVYLVIKEIMQCHTEAGIEEALHELPPDLEPLYERMERSLTNTLRSADRALSRRILTWVACAQRALTLEDLAEALKPEHNVLELRLTISQVCGDFVAVDSK